jgi:hypothetical protein
MSSLFKIGLTTSVYDFLSLDQFLSTSRDIDPDWSFQPFSGSVRLGDGTLFGTGFHVAKWRWNGMEDLHRQTLKELVSPGLSGPVYIQTATNDVDIYNSIVFKTYACVMNWPTEDEDFQADKVLGLILTFTHLVEELV